MEIEMIQEQEYACVYWPTAEWYDHEELEADESSMYEWDEALESLQKDVERCVERSKIQLTKEEEELVTLIKHRYAPYGCKSLVAFVDDLPNLNGKLKLFFERRNWEVCIWSNSGGTN
jgi:hypothetical protein